MFLMYEHNLISEWKTQLKLPYMELYRHILSSKDIGEDP